MVVILRVELCQSEAAADFRVAKLKMMGLRAHKAQGDVAVITSVITADGATQTDDDARSFHAPTAWHVIAEG